MSERYRHMRRRAAQAGCGLVLALTCLQPGCGHIQPAGTREVGKHRKTGRSISEAEVKAALQRLTQMYFDRSAEAIEQMEPQLGYELRDTLLRRVLIYDSAALAIATGTVPAVNMLDMLVFTRLTRETFESYWQPKVFGDKGQPLLDVLRDTEKEIWSTASSVLTPEQMGRLNVMIDRWKQQNPDRTRVELVRFEEFAKLVGDAELQKAASGALGSVEVMGKVADAAVLLGERAMFMSQFMPSLMRLQARLGALEMASDGMALLSEHREVGSNASSLLDRSQNLLNSVQELTQRAESLEPMLQETVLLTQNMERIVHEAQALNASLGPLGDRMAPLLATRINADGVEEMALERLLRESNQLAERSLVLVEQVNRLVPADQDKRPVAAGKRRGLLDAMEEEIESGARKFLGGLCLVGAAWATFFCGGYYLVRRRLDARAARGGGTSGGRHGHAGPRPSVT